MAALEWMMEEHLSVKAAQASAAPVLVKEGKTLVKAAPE
jgi:hypothetical protein